MMSLILFCLSLGHADLDQHQQKGLGDTKAMLQSPSEREAYLKTDKSARQVDDKVNALAGSSENKEEIYGISASVMDRLTQEANGDPAKMQKILLEAQGNPQAFYEKYFNEKDKAAVRGVATKIDAKKPALAPH